MTYKKRLVCLLVIISVLALTYAGSIIFSYDMGNARSVSLVWLEPGNAGRVNRIVINSEWEEYELSADNSQWFVSHNDNRYPARLARIEDFLRTLTVRSPWPVRSAGASAHDRFGLGEDAYRITLYADNSILLDLLIGDDDITGFDAYVRRAGQNEVRSGSNNLKAFLRPPSTWYNLRLIPESEGRNVDSLNVQRLSVFSGETAFGEYHFTRRNRGWDISGIVVENPDFISIESYILDILNAEGINFNDSISSLDPMFNHARIVLEFGNGSVITIRLTEIDEEGNRLAHVSGRTLIFTIPGWVAGRLFRNAAAFEAL